MHFLSHQICSSIDELAAMRFEVCEHEKTESLQCFLHKEINHLSEIIDIPMFCEADQIRVYSSLRARAVVVE